MYNKYTLNLQLESAVYLNMLSAVVCEFHVNSTQHVIANA